MFGHVADKYGRRKSFFIMLFMEVIYALKETVSVNSNDLFN